MSGLQKAQKDLQEELDSVRARRALDEKERDARDHEQKMFDLKLKQSRELN